MKRTHQLSFFGLFLLLIIGYGCKKNEPVDFHYGYFPMNRGHYVIYQVKDIYIDDTVNQYDTTAFYIKAIFGDTVTDNSGRPARRYERWYGPTPNGPWNLVDIWTAIIDGTRAELVEENNRTIKLIFPPTQYQEWNANAYNTIDPLSCYYTDIHLPYSLSGISFDSTVTVEQEDVKNLVQYKRKYERYAKGVGMIQKVFVDCEIDNFDTLQVRKARKLYMNAVSYGEE